MTEPARRTRRFPVGAEPDSEGTSFRVWAPATAAVDVLIENRGSGAPESHPLIAEGGGYFGGSITGVAAGDRYRFRLATGDFPDPASRFQPEGPHGPSEIVDPSTFAWTDHEWAGFRREDSHVIYELHIGTFTRGGTFASAIERLPSLVEIGITMIEVMPIADFPGRFGWGYDGVSLWAPSHLYGRPDDLRRFVDAAHGLGLSVILDVVYNHFGPDGNYLAQFSKSYFTDRHVNDWGDSINFDGDDSGPVRELFISNAACWISEFHLDGLRLDATQSIKDYRNEGEHILAAIERSARGAAAGRPIFIVAENEPQESRLIRPRPDGFNLDALWNDDFHHSAIVAATGKREAYYTDYLGEPQELISAAKWGFLYQGQWYSWQQDGRGDSGLDLDGRKFVCYLENHDQVANSAYGLRLQASTSPGVYRTLTALLLLIPSTPMLFQGEEFGSSAPFLYFADHEGELGRKVADGRKEFLSQFPSMTSESFQATLPDPSSPDTFERCILDWGERSKNQAAVALHRDLLRLRRDDETISRRDSTILHGAVLGEHAFLLRCLTSGTGDRLLLFNLGDDHPLSPLPQPLMAPPRGTKWELLWSSESPEYGGSGVAELRTDSGWTLSSHTALVLKPREEEPR